MTTYTDEQPLRTVRLYGYLGAKFGRVHRLAVASCTEAVQALAVLLPGFEREMMTSQDRGVGYACFLGKRNLSEDRLSDPAGVEDIRIAPMIQGLRGAVCSLWFLVRRCFLQLLIWLASTQLWVRPLSVRRWHWGLLWGPQAST